MSNSIRNFASSDGPRPVAAISNRPLLELRNLSTHYISAQGSRVVRAVDDVTLTIKAGETLGIVGESGSGKSTLALTILRVLPPAAHIVGGQMLFEGEDLVQKSDVEMRQVRGKRIGLVSQDPARLEGEPHCAGVAGERVSDLRNEKPEQYNSISIAIASGPRDWLRLLTP